MKSDFCFLLAFPAISLLGRILLAGKFQVFILFPLFVFLSCTGKSINVASESGNDSIPEGAIPFEYDFKMKKVILIPGLLDDSIPMKYLLETGLGVTVFSDSFVYDFERDGRVQKLKTIQIGKWRKSYGDSLKANYLDKDNSMYRRFLEEQVAFIPWHFFDKKIIEISFTHQYIREIFTTKNLSEYDSIKVTIDSGLLKIPVTVFLQGKKIKEFVFIDTGFNGDLSLNYDISLKYKINAENATHGESMGYSVKHPRFSLPTDAIKVGENFVTSGHYISFAAEKAQLMPFGGLIGTRFFENFDVILDLKNYYLYLKPVKRNN